MKNRVAKTEIVALALGSNVGDRMAAIKAAAAAMAPYVRITAASDVYETAPVYVNDQPAFLNAAVVGETGLEPLVLLRALKGLESELGRVPTFQYGPRLIDIDIVFYGDRVLKMPELIIPHPRMAEREFLLRPLSEIAPGWKHPETGADVTEMLATVPSDNPSRVGPLL